MKLSDLLIPEFDQEMTTARKTLERIFPKTNSRGNRTRNRYPLTGLRGTLPSWQAGQFPQLNRIPLTSDLRVSRRFSRHSPRPRNRFSEYLTRTGKRAAARSPGRVMST